MALSEARSLMRWSPAHPSNQAGSAGHNLAWAAVLIVAGAATGRCDVVVDPCAPIAADAGAATSAGVPTDLGPAVGEAASGPDTSGRPVAPPRGQQRLRRAQRRWFQVVLGVILALIALLFGLILLLSLVRASRFHKRRLGLGKKGPRTPYVDAWKHYRLRDDQLPDADAGPSDTRNG